MSMKTDVRGAVLTELAELNVSQQREVLDFVHFLRVKRAVDPDQAYFWTRRWQQLERTADRASTRGKRLGDGTAQGLVKALRARS